MLLGLGPVVFEGVAELLGVRPCGPYWGAPSGSAFGIVDVAQEVHEEVVQGLERHREAFQSIGQGSSGQTSSGPDTQLSTPPERRGCGRAAGNQVSPGRAGGRRW